MYDHEPAAIFHEFLKIRLHRRGPFLTIVVAYNHVVLRKRRAPFLPLFSVQLIGRLDSLGALLLGEVAGGARPLRGCGDVHAEHLRRLELGFHPRCHRTPVVVVLPVNDEHTDVFRLRFQGQGGNKGDCKQGLNDFFHENWNARIVGHRRWVQRKNGESQTAYLGSESSRSASSKRKSTAVNGS